MFAVGKFYVAIDSSDDFHHDIPLSPHKQYFPIRGKWIKNAYINQLLDRTISFITRLFCFPDNKRNVNLFDYPFAIFVVWFQSCGLQLCDTRRFNCIPIIYKCIWFFLFNFHINFMTYQFTKSVRLKSHCCVFEYRAICIGMPSIPSIVLIVVDELSATGHQRPTGRFFYSVHDVVVCSPPVTNNSSLSMEWLESTGFGSRYSIFNEKHPFVHNSIGILVNDWDRSFSARIYTTRHLRGLERVENIELHWYHYAVVHSPARHCPIDWIVFKAIRSSRTAW